MELIADILMIAATFAMAIYCIVLSRRLSRFTDLEKGVGGAIAVLSAQVDDMTKTLSKAQKTAAISSKQLDDLTQRAEGASRRLELLIASTQDLPEPTSRPDAPADVVTNQERPSEVEGDEDAQSAVFLRHRNRVEAAE